MCDFPRGVEKKYTPGESIGILDFDGCASLLLQSS
jgi:hypothetical protein